MAFLNTWSFNSSGATGFGVRLLNQLMKKTASNIEQTLSIIKPDAVERNLSKKLN